MIPPALTVKEVADSDNPKNEGIRDIQNPRGPDKVKLSVFENRGMFSKNLPGTELCPPPINRHKSLTRWAGPSSGTGNVLS